MNNAANIQKAPTWDDVRAASEELDRMTSLTVLKACDVGDMLRAIRLTAPTAEVFTADVVKTFHEKKRAQQWANELIVLSFRRSAVMEALSNGQANDSIRSAYEHVKELPAPTEETAERDRWPRAKRGPKTGTRQARPEEEKPMNTWCTKRFGYGLNTGARARLIADLDQRTPGWRSLRGDELVAAYDRSGDVVFAKARKNEPAPQDEPGVIKVKIEEWEEIQRAQTKMQERSEWLFRREREVKQLERHVEMRRAGIAPVMSYDEFAVLRKVLHPDQYPEIPEGDPRRERLQRAFSVVSRLPDSIDEDTPLSVLKRLGWEGHVAGKKRRAA